MANSTVATFFYISSSLLGFVVLLGIAIVSISRGGGRRTSVLFAGICLLGALLNANVALVSFLHNESRALLIDRAVHFFIVFSVPMYIRFIHEFLKIRTRRWLENTAWLLGVILAISIPAGLYIDGFHYFFFGRIARAGPLFYLFFALTVFTVFYCLAVLYRAMRLTEDNVERNRITYIFGGLGFSAFFLTFTMVPVLGVPVYPLGNFSFIPALFLAYGVLKYDLLDIGTLLRRGAAYFVLTGILTALYIVLIFLFNTFFLSSFGGNSITLSIFMALVIVLLFNPLRDFVQKLVDRIFFRGRYNYHLLLKTISGQLASLLSLQQIKELLVNEISEAMQVERVVLVIGEQNSYRIFGTMERPKTAEEIADELHLVDAMLHSFENPMSRGAIVGNIPDGKERDSVNSMFDCIGATLVVPFPVREGTSGMIFLGQKKSGELFVDEDMEMLTTIANQAATAIENAGSYEALQRLNRDLENIVKERTKDLQDALSEMERAEQHLIQSESLAAIGQLVAGAAHELNNPIAGAMSLVETSVETITEWTIPARDRQKEEVVDDLRFSISELRRSAGIIRSLLDLSRQTQTYVEPVNMNTVIDDALKVLFNQYKNLPVRIEKNYAEDMPPVEGNFANLGQVMINIIQNALQALPEGGGEIALTTTCQKETDTVSITCSDDGSGIPKDVIGDIFKPFFTTKGVGRGTGLGLYISHEIIRRHGGRIDIGSESGKGTVVRIELPCKRRGA
jgi:two-component system NtrC family sensor kinase